jgi:hypothetical protein
LTAVLTLVNLSTEANPKAPQRTGPTGQAIAIVAVGLAAAYYMFGQSSNTKGLYRVNKDEIFRFSIYSLTCLTILLRKAKDAAAGEISLKEPENTTHSDKL